MRSFWLAVVLACGCSRPPAHVLGFAGHGGPGWFTLSGRVLSGPPARAPDASRARRDNVVDTLSLVESDEVKEATVEATLGGVAYRAKTDGDGVFVFVAHDLAVPLAPGRHEVAVRLIDPKGADGLAELFVADGAPGIAVVSDIDDTIVETHVTSLTRMVDTVLTRNAAQLRPTPGMAPAYQAARDAGVASFFYVSSSPHNLYPRLRAFVDLAGYPAGPLLLKNFGEDALSDHRGYKARRIQALFTSYPNLRFVLVGDSGEQDPVIYRALREAHPQRVVAIVIREVPGKPLANADGVTVVRSDGSNAAAIAEAVAVARGVAP